MRRTAWFLSLLSLIALVGIGCTPPVVMAGKSPPMIYEKGISLSPSTTEIMFSLPGSLKLAGRTESCNYPNGVKGAPVVMKGVKPEFEQITSMQPHLVLYDADVISEQDVAKLKELGIETFGFEARTIDGFMKELILLGSKIAGEIKLSTYADQIYAAKGSAMGAAPKVKIKAAVLLGGGGAEHWVAGTDSFLADVMRTCGAEPVGPKAQKFAMMNAEAFLASNPDVIFVAGDPTSVMKDPRLAQVAAIKNGHVAGLKEDILLRKGARLPKLINNMSAVIQGAAK